MLITCCFLSPPPTRADKSSRIHRLYALAFARSPICAPAMNRAAYKLDLVAAAPAEPRPGSLVFNPFSYLSIHFRGKAPGRGRGSKDSRFEQEEGKKIIVIKGNRPAVSRASIRNGFFFPSFPPRRV